MNSNVEILDDIDKVTIGARNDFYFDFFRFSKISQLVTSINIFNMFDYNDVDDNVMLVTLLC